nr:aminoglycoside phosphotransferase family protein [Paenibacillus bovis]
MNLGIPIAEGNTATIYHWDNKIIKIFKDHLPNTEATYEANKQKLAYACGLTVPKIYDVTEIDGKQAIIMEYFKGPTIGSLLMDNKDKSKYYMEISVDIQLEIHSKSAGSLEHMRSKLSRQINNASQINDRLNEKLITKLHSMTFESRLCHGDFHLFNLILSDEKVVIIDWVDASAGDIRADVYRTYLLYSQLSTDLAELYVQLYCKKSGISREEIFQWAPIIAAARLSENVSTERADRLLKIIDQYLPL